MLISNLISESSIVANLPGLNKEQVLANLAYALAEALPKADPERILEALQERERLGSTGIGKGIAIPHGRCVWIKKPVAVFGRSVEGVDFAANDGKPVHLFIALLSPVRAVKPHLKALSAISQLLNHQTRRKKLLAAADEKALYDALIMGEKEG
jgi:nitrogen PTS system EIIA component